MIDRGWAEEGDWMVRAGGAAARPYDPHVLGLASPRPEYLIGALLMLAMRPDVVRCAFARAPSGGLTRAEVRFSSPVGAGEVAAWLKSSGARVLLNPVVRDDEFDRVFRNGRPPEEFLLPLGVPLTSARFVGGRQKEWAAGPAWLPGQVPSPRKLCLACADPGRLERVLAAAVTHPRALGAKSNVDGRDKPSWFGRIAFVDDTSAGWMCQQLEAECPDVNPMVQDDDWFNQFRREAPVSAVPAS